MLTHERVRQAFDYDPLEGILRWKISPGNRKIKAGRIAGSKPCPRGYIYVRLDRERYGIHRLIWFWMTAEWPTETIDHRDLNPSNNQWINLREANESEQRWNMGLTRRKWLKQDCLRACIALGFFPKTDDEADALGIWLYGEMLFSQADSNERMPLFNTVRV